MKLTPFWKRSVPRCPLCKKKMKENPDRKDDWMCTVSHNKKSK